MFVCICEYAIKRMNIKKKLMLIVDFLPQDSAKMFCLFSLRTIRTFFFVGSHTKRESEI